MFGKIKSCAVLGIIGVLCLSPLCYADTIDFGCSSTGTGMRVYTKNVAEDAELEMSFDGGKNFFRISPQGKFFPSLPENTYQVCMRYKDKPDTTTQVCPVKVSQSEEPPIKIRCTGVREETYKSGCILIEIEDFDRSQIYKYSINGGASWTRMKNPEILIDKLSGGYYNVIVKNDHTGETSGVLPTCVPYPLKKDYVDIPVPVVSQRPELPTGCEVTSLDMALRYYGFPVEKTTLADHFLDKAAYQTADFRKKFVGDPRTYMAYGCYSDVIENCAHKFLDSIRGRSFDIINLTGSDFDRVLSFVDMGYPVVVWATIGMAEPSNGSSWVDLETGNTVTWYLCSSSAAVTVSSLPSRAKTAAFCSRHISPQTSNASLIL